MSIRLAFIWLSFFTLPALASSASAQGTISGRVVDGQSGDALIGATIFLKGTNFGTICDFEGNFQLFNVPVGKYVLVSSMIGYQNTSVTGIEVVEGQVCKLNIALSSETIELEEETVIEVKALRSTDAGLLKTGRKLQL